VLHVKHLEWKILALIRTLIVSVLLMMFAVPSSGKSKAAPPVDLDYVYALATANHFLQAWQMQDQETAVLLLSDRLKQRTRESSLDALLTSNVSKPQSFEIGRGKKLAPGRYQFPVALFQAKAKWSHPQTAALVVVKDGNEWTIDKLP
jgi:hypothetical protein